MHTKRNQFFCTPMWDECTGTPLLLFLGPGINALGYCWFGQRDSTIYFLTRKKEEKKKMDLNLNRKKKSTSRTWLLCLKTGRKWELWREMELKWYYSYQPWKQRPEGVLNFCWTCFFVIPCSWIDTAVAWSSSWASPTYQAAWETSQGEGGRGNPHAMVCAVHCGAQADAACPGQLSACPALLGVTAGEEQLSSVGKASMDNYT